MATKIDTKTTFRSTLADGNPLWRVTRPRGPGVWEATVVNEPVMIDGKKYDSDFVGSTRVFTTAQITAAVKAHQFWASKNNEHTRFFASLKVGQIVHYEHGRNSYVRCEVVMGNPRTIEGTHKGVPIKCLKPIALVGDWYDSDLPKRRLDGTVDYGYQAEKIRSGETMMPNSSCIYEAIPKNEHTDPRGLAPLDLSVPPMSDEDAAAAKLWQAVNQVRNAVSYENGGRDPKAMLQAALAAIQAVA